MVRNILGVALVVALIAALLGSDRDWFLSDQYRAVAHVADIPRDRQGALLGQLEGIVQSGGVHIPRLGPKAERIVFAALGITHAPLTSELDQADYWPKLGYSVREISFLGMPFGYFTDMGPVVYTESRWELVAAPLVDQAWTQFDKEVGRDLRRGFFYPFWRHCWGWLFVAGIALWGWLRHRWVVGMRAEQGLI